MPHAYTVLMFVFQGVALSLLSFLGIRYRGNISSIREKGPKATWSRLFLLFLISAFMTESLTWTQGYIKCLDTSHSLRTLLPEPEFANVCDMWNPLDDTLKRALFTLYLIFELVAVCSFQALVLERYRKVAHLFPDWVSKYALPAYTAAYIPIGICACITSILEFYLSPSTLISRDATINTISSAFYCIWIVLTGLSDAILSFLIVSKVRQAKLAFYDDSQTSDPSNASTTVIDRQQFSRLRHLQTFFAIIVVFDFCILSLTALKKINSHGLHGHVFAYEVASIEIACTLIHCTLTLCFMQFLGVILRKTQPQFEFVIQSAKVKSQGMSFFSISKRASLARLQISTSSTDSGMTEDLEEYNKAHSGAWKSFTVMTQELGSQPTSPTGEWDPMSEITVEHSK